MIYRVVLDDTIDLHTSDINCMLLNPSLDLEMNSAGSFNFTLPPSHPYWDSIKVLKSTIDVYEDGDLIFTGRIASIEKNWNNERVVQCEGALAYFNDSIHRQMKWETPLPIASEDPTVHNFLKDILDNHNVFEGAENANRHIFIGNITVDPEVVTREVNYDTTLDILTRMCIDTNGGYMSVRKNLDDGKLYLDWIKDFTEESGQPAQFGLNLLNFDTSLAAEDICTGVLARGAEVNEQTVMLNNVELVDETTYPDMSVTHYTDKYQDILWHREGVEKFGQVVQVHDFSDAQTAWKDGQGQIVANSLFEMAKKWLEEKNTKIETIEVEVAELAWLGEGMPKYKLGQIVELSDNVHMADESYETRLLPMYKLSCDLNSGSKKVTLGTPPKKELTQISASNSDSSTLSSSGSSSGSGGSGEGEECRVHDVKVNGTSVVTDKIANVQVPTDTVTTSQMTQAIRTAVAPKANTADVNQALAQKQNTLVFNSQDAATAHLTKIKNGNDVYDIPTGTEVVANPTGTATSDLTKLKVGSDIYGIPSGGTQVEANPVEAATDDLETIKIGNTVYDIPGSGGGSTNYGKFKCDVLFNTPDTSTSFNDPVIICSEEKAKEYDMLHFVTYTYSGRAMVETVLVSDIKQESDNHYVLSPRTDTNVNGYEYFAYITYSNGNLVLYGATNKNVTVEKVYGLKFENKAINRSDIYSEDEQMIGRWTDGKPLYQKTIVKDLTLSSSWQNYYDLTGIDLVNVEIDKLIRDNEPIPLAFSNVGVGSWIKRDGYLKFCIQGSQASEGWVLKAVTIRYTKTTDSADSGVIPEDPMFISDPMIFSEEEQVVGSWTDGKPLYQKTWIKVLPSAHDYDGGLAYLIDSDVSYIDEMISGNGYLKETTVGAVSILNGGIPNMDGWSYGIHISGTKQLVLYGATRTTYVPGATAVITLQYTKTTDSILSGPKKGKIVQRSDIYSEEERLIGRWTDGNPLYQKTYRNISITNNTDNIIDSNFGTDKNICTHDIEFRGISGNSRCDYNTSVNDTLYSNNNGQLVYYFYKSGSWSQLFDTVDITIQYTKTTDLPFSKQLIEDPQFVMMSDIYSEDEQVVGRWTDGKPLYQKVVDCGYGPNSDTKSVDLTALNIDNCIQIGGYMCHNVTNFLPIPRVSDRYIADQLAFSYNNSTKLLNITCRDRDMTSMRIMAILKYTKTTDAPGTGPTKGNLIYLPALYSEEEREVGVWTDGKPLYQKMIPIPAIQSAQSGVLISNLGLNIDNCVDIKVRLYKDTAPDNDTVIATASFGDMYFYYRKSEDSIRMDAPFSWVVGRYGNATIQYTKTTDQPGSGTWTPEGQLAHHYSTSEKIVGTWIDGSTVYERTIQLTANLVTNDTAWTQVQYDNPVTNMSHLIDCKVLDGTGTYLVERFSSNNQMLSAASKYSGTSWNAGTFMTIQYTKTS